MTFSGEFPVFRTRSVAQATRHTPQTVDRDRAASLSFEGLIDHQAFFIQGASLSIIALLERHIAQVRKPRRNTALVANATKQGQTFAVVYGSLRVIALEARQRSEV